MSTIEIDQMTNPKTDEYDRHDRHGLDHCIDQFSIDFPTHKLRDALSVTAGLSKARTTSYCNGRSKPIGLYWLKVAYALHFMGYKVAVLEKLQPNIYNFGKLLAIGAVSTEDAEKLLDMNISCSFAVIKGTRTLNATRREMVHMLVEENMGKIDKWNEQHQKYKSIRSNLRPIASQAIETETPVKPTKAETELDVIEILANAIKAMLPLAEIVASDEYSADDRIRLRELVGMYGVFNLKNALTKLCGERARMEL